jgi:hypothetical protein
LTRSRLLRVVAAVVAMLTLSATAACSTHPGDAAVVGSQSLSTSDVDDLAGALCAAQDSNTQAPQTQEVPARAARQSALRLLIDARLSAAYGKSIGVQPAQQQVDSALDSQEQTLKAVKGKDHTILKDTITDVVKGQLILIEVGRRDLIQKGTPAAQVTADTALQAGTKLRDEWAAKHVDVSVDPRFGTYKQGDYQPGSGSLSVPVSSSSKHGAAAQPPSSWTAALPASQKCN